MIERLPEGDTRSHHPVHSIHSSPSVMMPLSTNAVLLEFRRQREHAKRGSTASPPTASSHSPNGQNDKTASLRDDGNASDDFSEREATSPPTFSPCYDVEVMNTKKDDMLGSHANDQFGDVDWDEVNRGAEQQRIKKDISVSHDIDQQGTIGFLDAVRCIKNDKYAWEPYVSSQRFIESDGKNCVTSLLKCVRGLLCSHGLLSTQDTLISEDPNSLLQRDTEFALTLPYVPFDHSNTLHRKLLLTIHSGLLRRTPQGANTTSSRSGAIDWEVLGFQGSDPATDLRSTGIFGLLQLVYLAAYYTDFTMQLWTTCTRGGNGLTVYEDLPFVLVGFNFSAVLLDMLKENKFYVEILHRARILHTSKTKGDLISTMNNDSREALSHEFPLLFVLCEYYIGCLFLFWESWQALKVQRDGKPPTIGDFAVVKAKLCATIKNNSSSVFDACARARHS